MPAARSSKIDAGGVLRMNVKVRSVYTVTSTGKIIPSGSLAVLALNCLQKSIMFKPCGPSAVPTGGAGVALPAGNCNLMVVCTFFGGICYYLKSFSRSDPSLRSGLGKLSKLLDTRKIQFNWSGASENRYRNFETAVIVVDFFDGAIEIREGAIDDANLFVAFVDNLGLRAILRGVHAIDDGVHFRFG